MINNYIYQSCTNYYSETSIVVTLGPPKVAAIER